jgi:hypothetical protein
VVPEWVTKEEEEVKTEPKVVEADKSEPVVGQDGTPEPKAREDEEKQEEEAAPVVVEAKALRQRYWESRLHQPAVYTVLVVVLFLLAGFWTPFYYSARVWINSHSFGNVVRYCGRQGSGWEYAFGKWETRCYDTKPLFSVDFYDRVEFWGLRYHEMVHELNIPPEIKVFTGAPWYEDVPLFYGVGRWLTGWGATKLTERVTLVASGWEVATDVCYVVLCIILVVWTFYTSIGWLMKRGVWLFRGEVVERGGLSKVLTKRAELLGLDEELFAYLYSCVAFKLRDSRTPAALMSSGKAWVQKYRKHWNEVQIASGVSDCMVEAMSLCDAEETAHTLWGTRRIYDGLKKARALAVGTLNWGRQLDN